MNFLPGRIAVESDTCGGRPFFKGTRIPVYVVLEMLTNRETWEDVSEAFPDLTQQDLHDSLEYAKNLAEMPRQHVAIAHA